MERLNLLPDDLINSHVWPNLPHSTKVWLNKSCYKTFHYCIRDMVPANVYDSYIRNVIRYDDCIVFELLLLENFDKWIKILKYSYKEYVFYNYIFFLSHFALENTATKCYSLINSYLKTAGYEKKWHKKNSIKYIRWSN